MTTTPSWNAEAPSEAFRAVVLAEQRASIEGDSDGCCIILNESGVDDRWLMIVAVSALAGLCKGPSGEPDALDGLSDVLRAELLTLTSSGSVRLAHWRAWHHDVSAELYAWLNREYARLGLIAGVGRGSVSSTRSRAARPYP